MKHINWEVSEDTVIINRIKDNNRAVELLEIIEKAIDELNYNSLSKLVYLEENETKLYSPESDDIDDNRSEEFFNSITDWTMKNCVHLVADSMQQYTQINKPTKKQKVNNDPY